MPDTDLPAFHDLVLRNAIDRLGMLEDRGRPNHGTIVRLSLQGAIRAGRPAGIAEGVAWCAGFAGLCLFDADILAAKAWTPDRFRAGEVAQPIGWRLAVWECVADARRTGTFFEMGAAIEPLPGDLIVCGRDGQDPRKPGQLGHICILDEVKDGALLCIGGNEAAPVPGDTDGVRRSLRRWSDPREPIVGWIRVSADREALSVAQR